MAVLTPRVPLLGLSKFGLTYVASRFLATQSSSTSRDLKKEWKISIGKSEDDVSFTVKLNGINLKTPMKNLLRIPDETLAHSIANEWKANSMKKKIDLRTMHLTTLAYTAIDNPFHESNEAISQSLLEYLKFDTVRYRDVEQEELCKRQSRHWDPIIGWFEHTFECHLPIEYGDITSSGNIPKSTEEIILKNLNSHGRWPLVGLRFVTENLKSLVLAKSLAKRFLRVEQAVDVARLETKYQCEKWTKVEWEHDIDEQVTCARVAAGTLLYHLSL